MDLCLSQVTWMLLNCFNTLIFAKWFRKQFASVNHVVTPTSEICQYLLES